MTVAAVLPELDRNLRRSPPVSGSNGTASQAAEVPVVTTALAAGKPGTLPRSVLVERSEEIRPEPVGVPALAAATTTVKGDRLAEERGAPSQEAVRVVVVATCWAVRDQAFSIAGHRRSVG